MRIAREAIAGVSFTCKGTAVPGRFNTPAYPKLKALAGRCEALPRFDRATYLGSIPFEVPGSFGEVRYCHCIHCRRGNGTAFSANAKVPRASRTASDPEGPIRENKQKLGFFRAVYSRCGPPIDAHLDSDHVRVRLGGFDGPLDVHVTAHVWISSKAPWYALEGDLPCFGERFESSDLAATSVCFEKGPQ